MKVQNILEEHILSLKFGDNLSLINTSAGDGAESAEKRLKKKKLVNDVYQRSGSIKERLNYNNFKYATKKAAVQLKALSLDATRGGQDLPHLFNSKSKQLMQTFFKYKDRSRFCDLQSSSNSSDNSDHEK